MKDQWANMFWPSDKVKYVRNQTEWDGITVFTDECAVNEALVKSVNRS